MTSNEKLKDIRWRVQELLGRIDELLKLEDQPEPLPCPHGRLPLAHQDGWKHCPHCLGINSTVC